ncbi:hypothetical protein LOAG_16752 [Loa loa]|nr:hypothetical protein LOAG_16752 [Loa loa]EJD76253.1 hypothetical protein LOAG_16752 [Loa loa]
MPETQKKQLETVLLRFDEKESSDWAGKTPKIIMQIFCRITEIKATFKQNFHNIRQTG